MSNQEAKTPSEGYLPTWGSIEEEREALHEDWIRKAARISRLESALAYLLSHPGREAEDYALAALRGAEGVTATEKPQQ